MFNPRNFDLLEIIHESQNSVVHRALCKRTGAAVVIKCLKEAARSPEKLYRYAQEHSILETLNARGVIGLLGFEQENNQSFLVLEDVGGRSLKSVFSGRAARLDEFFPVAIGICEGLAHIHLADVIHKDINPANIVYNPATHVVKIVDFGISSRLPRLNPALQNPEFLEGTLAYISPEQTGRMNRAVDYRTDLYSLGATFYELLTGRPPFSSNEAHDLVHCHIARQPLPPDEVNPDVPALLSALVLRLLAKNAEDRYQSAWGVKADLEWMWGEFKAGRALPAWFELGQWDAPHRFQISQHLYGRESVTARLLAMFDSVAQGTPGMALIAGYSGIGKTSVVRELHKPMASSGGFFIGGKFDQLQKNIPYSALIAAIGDLVSQLLVSSEEVLGRFRREIAAALGQDGQVLTSVIPDLELIIGPQPAVAALPVNEAQQRMNRLFRRFFQVFARPT